MSEIKVGEYVRTKDGYIAKLIKIEQEPNVIGKTYFFDNNVLGDCDEWNLSENYLENIIKHSLDIIDLVQKGDYVNGSKVVDIVQAPIKAVYIENQEQKFALIPIINKQIKSVVTKEQFSQMEYKVEE